MYYVGGFSMSCTGRQALGESVVVVREVFTYN